jgi:hypothetical protein
MRSPATRLGHIVAHVPFRYPAVVEVFMRRQVPFVGCVMAPLEALAGVAVVYGQYGQEAGELLVARRSAAAQGEEV